VRGHGEDGATRVALVRERFLALQFFVEGARSGMMIDLRQGRPLEFSEPVRRDCAHLLVQCKCPSAVLWRPGRQALRVPQAGCSSFAALFGEGMLDGVRTDLDFVFRRCRASVEKSESYKNFFHD